jgi:hypothetical protein
MKKHIFITVLVLLSMKAFSQENAVTLSGGYSFANIEDTDIKATGFRINGSYEFNPNGGKFAHGFSFGYIGLKAEETIGQTVQSYTINSFPLYYAPKVMFGKDKLKIFIKGALGMQFAGLKREGAVSISDNDFGFYGGGGAGIMIFLKENIFINGEYEIAWASNNWYKDGWINTAGGGIGFKF